MKIALIYIKAGNGHYIPAKTLAESLKNNEVDVVLADFYNDILKQQKLSEKITKNWTTTTNFPWLQRISAAIENKTFVGNISRTAYSNSMKKYKSYLKSFIEENKIDAIITTSSHPTAILLSSLKHIDEITIPIICYSSDVISEKMIVLKTYGIDAYISPSTYHHEYLKKYGIDENIIIDIPYPLKM